MTIGIYKITELASGQCYIGQSKHIEQRWIAHHKRFSPDSFTYEILRIVNIPHFMNIFEKYYVKLFDSHLNGFNLTIGGSSVKIKHPSAETRDKHSKARKGKKLSDETRARMSEVRKGKIQTVEQRAKTSKIHKGKTVSDETRNKIAETLRNKRNGKN